MGNAASKSELAQFFEQYEEAKSSDKENHVCGIKDTQSSSFRLESCPFEMERLYTFGDDEMSGVTLLHVLQDMFDLHENLHMYDAALFTNS